MAGSGGKPGPEVVDGSAHVLLDEVVVDGDRGGGALAGRGDDLGARVGGVLAGQGVAALAAGTPDVGIDVSERCYLEVGAGDDRNLRGGDSQKD